MVLTKEVKFSSFLWIDYLDPSKRELSLVSRKYDIAIDDLTALLDINEKARIINKKNYSIVIFISNTKEKFLTFPLGLIIDKKKGFIITIHKYKVESINEIIKNLYNLKSRIKSLSSFVNLILFNITKEAAYNLENIEDDIEKIENKVFKGGSVEKDIFPIKRKLLYYRRASLNNKDVVHNIESGYLPEIKDGFDKILTEINENLGFEEIARARLVEALEINLSNSSNKLNETMKILTVIASLLLFPMLISGIYGMNFIVLPLKDNIYGFWITLLMMIIGSLLLLLFFRKKNLI